MVDVSYPIDSSFPPRTPPLAKHIACISFSLPPSFPPFGLFGGSRLRLEPGADSGGEEKEEEGEGPLGGGMSGGGREEGTSTMTTGFAAGRGKGPFLSLSSLFSCTRLPGELEGGGSSSFRCFAAERGEKTSGGGGIYKKIPRITGFFLLCLGTKSYT